MIISVHTPKQLERRFPPALSTAMARNVSCWITPTIQQTSAHSFTSIRTMFGAGGSMRLEAWT